MSQLRAYKPKVWFWPELPCDYHYKPKPKKRVEKIRQYNFNLTSKALGRGVEASSKLTRISVNNILGNKKSHAISQARMIVYWAGINSEISSVKVSEFFGRDHTTVLQGAKKINGLIEIDEQVREICLKVLDAINGDR